MKANDKLRYVVNCGENNNSSFDSVNIEAAFSYEVGGEQKTFTAKNNAWTTEDGKGSETSQFGSAYQKQAVVQYEYATILQGTEKATEATDGVKVLLSEKPLNVCTIGSDKMWMVSADTLNTYCSYYNGYNYIVPGANSMTAIVFTAPCDGTISNAFGCGSVTAENADGDGMRMNVVLNDTVIYPKQGLWATPSYGTDLEISYNNQTIKQGDKLYYIAENGGDGDCSWDNLKSKIRFMWTDSATNKSCLIDFAENYYVLEEDGNKSVDILIFAGQSNMQGQSDCLSENAPVKGAWEYKYLSNTLMPLCNPVGENITYELKEGDPVNAEHIAEWLEEHALGAACFGNTNLVPSFCRAYLQKAEEEVVAVHAAKGSTQIADWLKGTKGYHALVTKVKSAIDKVGKENIGGIYLIWLQGESDAVYGVSSEEYERSLVAFKESLKEEISLSKFGIIKVGRFTMDARDEEILEAQERVCKTDKDFIMLTRITEKLIDQKEYMNPYWAGHYNAKGLEVIGDSAGAAFIKSMKK